MESYEIAKMRFVYNAILNGWTVKMLEDGRFEFVKDRQRITEDVNANSFLNNLFQRWLSIDAGHLRTSVED